jgi:proteasome lid subunit RPN8/RPN11
MAETILPRTLINELLTHAQHSPEEEVCGLIASRHGVPSRVYPVANIASERNHLFAMEPKAQIDAMRHMREAGEELYAIYHSHPHAPAEPSLRDLEEAAYPEALYLIISLNTKGVLEMRGFRLGEGAVESVELAVI